MIKTIGLATMLVATLPLNTIITNVSSATTELNEITEWTTETSNNITNAYRDGKPYTYLSNEAYTIHERKLEYFSKDTTNNTAINEFYFITQINPNNLNDLYKSIRETVIQILGEVNQLYEFTNSYYKIWKSDNLTLNSNIQNFIDGTQYTTVAQYQNIRGNLAQFFYNQTSNTITQQNVDNVFNLIIQNEEEGGSKYTTGFMVHFEYANQNPTGIYTPFGNYCNSVNYQKIRWDVDVPSTGTGEIVDIPGLLFSIIGMPFTFISQAFNLTIFPGTAYAVNISHVFLAIVGGAILIFIIKRLLK